MDLHLKAWQLPPRLITGAYFVSVLRQDSVRQLKLGLWP